ncbi:hypothetical protein SAMD00019534_058740 [Acytostelium subglobosum LB1]|uniref:hypothetical protein n=1 Tax=Acytostelium subglobosum LB1 TaxID=1410327 RepID=UPI000644ABCD|nr:hypothetical protein SAMD00019534_058740 [Acytostelium subglobosum LB1]GAM22699.1 hypothetical protein SAMD00019534_058740 [Acytostelium subglobosum LB1]|eukprot:XP_012754819.1 hypothetical protein SAMD00019534_058740 [Acytostelium subglobosum LB1]
MEKKSLPELKELCRSRGLKVGGNKPDLIARLNEAEANVAPATSTSTTTTTTAAAVSPATPAAKVSKKKKKRSDSDSSDSEEEKKPAKKARTPKKGVKPNSRNIVTLLKGVGCKFNMCGASAVARGHLQWDGTDEGLDKDATKGDGTLLKVKGLDCGHTWTPTLRDILEQTDYPGTDYEDGMESATITCPECESPVYLTNMCTGKFQEDSGKFHNHCTQCKGLGKCIGDYRNSHCPNCNKHYFAGLSGFDCSCRSKGRGRGGGFFGFGSDSGSDDDSY